MSEQDELNPNHGVTSEMRDQYHKLLAIIVGLGYGGATTITVADLERFTEQWPDAAIIVHSHADCIELRLVTREEGDQIAREHGGLPV